jgi:hypothetical protein
MNLTQVLSMDGGKKAPLMLEVPVSEELDGPFLVSSTQGVLWVEKLGSPSAWSQSLPTPPRLTLRRIRAAVRKIPLHSLYREAVEKVAEKAQELGWGSYQPATRQGFLRAAAYLEEYGLPEWEVLFGEGLGPSLFEDCQAMEVAWVPKNWALVVPRDRTYLGTAFDFGEGQTSLVLHNPSRAIAFVVS